MTEETIKLSTMGRAVQVGNLYNYFNAKIVKNQNFPVKESSIEFNYKSNCNKKLALIPQQPLKFKYYILGINSHLKLRVEKNVPSILNRLWFDNYIKINLSSQADVDKSAKVDMFLRVIQRTETLSQEFLTSKMDDYQQIGNQGEVTHLVERVTYGAEFIFSMERSINLQESKEDVENEIYLAAEKYLQQILESNSTSIEIPIELKDVKCVIHSSLPAYIYTGITYPLQLASKKIRDGLPSTNQMWSSIKMTLRLITSLNSLVSRDKFDDYKIKNEVRLNAIQQECKRLSTDPNLNKVLPLAQVSNDYMELFHPLRNKIEKFSTQTHLSDRVVKEYKTISELLTEIEKRVKKLELEVSKISLLLKDINLNISPLSEIQSLKSSRCGKGIRVFILRIHLNQDQLMDKVKKVLDYSNGKSSTLPEFLITEKEIQKCYTLLKGFASENKTGIDYYIGLVPAHETQSFDGDIMKMEYRKESINEQANLHEDSQSNISNDEYEADDVVPMEIDGECNDQSDYQSSYKDDKGNREAIKTLSNKQMVQFINTGKSYSIEIDQRPTTNENTAKIKKQKSLSCVNLEKDDIRMNQKQIADVGKKDKSSYSQVEKDARQEKMIDSQKGAQKVREITTPSNQRIAEIYVSDKSLCKLVRKTEKPKVYLLNAEEISVSEDIRWFNVIKSQVQSSLHHENHKVIILMGATGCGKSTLVNGMINYILGIKWNDPFRFEVIREDESAFGRDQAQSQTSSVTAYTLDHQDGMTVPYSITIIDTPGYGDTRGIQRDKEITQTIHRFLSQSETQFDQIHALCFVAASGDSRLTATQRYILDSVLSLFGKDVKDNIRLLVTFADNADPPVVEACTAAHFPVTSKSRGITYCKFNSSVLYASNEKTTENDDIFNELFWEMGHENFEIFFKMLEEMNGCDLTSTREVIQRRQLAEHTLKNIENEVDICLVKIENIEKFRRQIWKHSHNMEANKNFTVQIVEIHPNLVKCKPKVAYNCGKCKKTCLPPKIIQNFDKILNLPKPKCYLCPCSKTEHVFQHSEWRQEEVTVQTTLDEMKTKYEASCKQKLSIEDLLVECTHDLDMAKGKALSLLNQLEENSRSLDSAGLRSNALTPADYLSLMRSRVAEEQKPGYMIRLETLSELQRYLESKASPRRNK